MVKYVLMDIRDTMEYMVNSGDELIDEVIEERRLKRADQLHNREESNSLRLMNGVANIKGFNLEKRHPVIKDVLFSLAIQHGQRGSLILIKNALGDNVQNLDDASLINRLYDERSRVDKYLAQLSKEMRDNIKNKRYPNERKDALDRLRN